MDSERERKRGVVVLGLTLAIPAATLAAAVFAPEPTRLPPVMRHDHGPMAHSGPRFVCPMRCADGEAHAAPGSCPTCGMALVAAGGPHQDHDPKHGGTLIMADDGFHHLEGALHSPREFRLYLYDDYTRPLSAAGLGGRADAEIVAGDGASGATASEPLRVGEGGAYLWLPIPEAVSTPFEVDTLIALPGRAEPDRFDFWFGDSTGEDAVPR